MVVTWLGALRQAGLDARMGNTGTVRGGCPERAPARVRSGRGNGWQEGRSRWEQRTGGAHSLPCVY